MNEAQIAGAFPVPDARPSYADRVARLSDVPPGEPIAVSATLFLAYRRCPQQALARLRGHYPQPTRATFKGALAHRIFARHLDVGPIDDEEFALVCRQETGANLNAQLAASGLKPSEFGTVVAEVSSLYATFRSLPTDGFRSAEVSFDRPISDDLALRGRIDAVFEGERGDLLLDWKTGSELGSDVDAQLGFYALAWSHEHGSPPSETVAVSLATGERKSWTPTTSDLDETEEQIADMVIALRAAFDGGTDLDRTAGPHCRWCAVLSTCSEGSAALTLLGNHTLRGPGDRGVRRDET